MHICIGDIYNRFDWPAPPHCRAQPFPPSGPSFAAWAPPPSVRNLLPRRTLILGDIDPFWWCQKGGEISGSYFWVVFLCMYLDISLLFVWTCVCGHVLCFWFWGWHEPPILYGHLFIMIWQLSLLSPFGIYGWLSITSYSIFVPTFYHTI